MGPHVTAYIGTQDGENPPITLRLSLPAGFDKITFDKEFHVRNFQLLERCLTTELPWPPGSRELKFSYRLPVSQRQAILSPILDLPPENAVLRIIGKDIEPVTCNRPGAKTPTEDEARFASTASLPAGSKIELLLGAVPIRFEAYGRWLAAAVLAVLIIGSAVLISRSQV